METKVSLKIQFLFDPDAVWGRISEFEADLADFLATKGKEATKLKTYGTPQGEIIIEVRSMDKLDKARNETKITTGTAEQMRKAQGGKNGRK